MKVSTLTAMAAVIAMAPGAALAGMSKTNLEAAKPTASAKDKCAKEAAEPRKDASGDKREAEFVVEKQKCDVYGNTVKEACLNDAKARYGKGS
jgi:hypothetical protein